MKNSFELLSDVLDKLIETQIQSSSVTSELRSEVQSTNENLKEMHHLLDEVNRYFSNGFRFELKEHISKEIESIEGQLHEKARKDKEGHLSLLSKLEIIADAVTNPWSWVKAFMLIGSLFGVIAAITAVVLKIMGGI